MTTARSTTSSYLEAASDRVVVFDGAMGTNLQLADLTADDFGGPDLEGCNELLVVTRPDVVDRVHRSFFEVGCDVVETDTFGAFAPVLAEYGQDHRVRELNLAAAGLARGAADDFSTPDRPRWVAGSIGPGTKFPTLGQIRYADLRDAYEEQSVGPHRGRRRPHHHRDGLRPPAGQGGHQRRPAGHEGRRSPGAHPGPGDHRADRHHAARHRDRCRPVRPRGHGRRRHRSQLRHRAGRDVRAAPPPDRPRRRCRSAACPTPGCPRSWTVPCTTT